VAMTSAVKDELSRLAVSKTCCRRAEVSSLLRFAGGLHIVSGRVVVEAELDLGSAARRLLKEIQALYGHHGSAAASMITKLRNRVGFISGPSRILISERKEPRLVPMSGIRGVRV